MWLGSRLPIAGPMFFYVPRRFVQNRLADRAYDPPILRGTQTCPANFESVIPDVLPISDVVLGKFLQALSINRRMELPLHEDWFRAPRRKDYFEVHIDQFSRDAMTESLLGHPCDGYSHQSPPAALRHVHLGRWWEQVRSANHSIESGFFQYLSSFLDREPASRSRSGSAGSPCCISMLV